MTITTEKLDEIERGLQGVTPGEWRRGQLGNASVYGPDAQGEHSGLIARVFKGSENVAHIARLDPTTVAELVRLARIGLAAEARPDIAAVLRGDAVVVPREEAETRRWHAGEPPKPWRNEWFIAETIHGDRVCLKALPEDWTYDYKTADETYIMARKIKRWMRFPDSDFIEPDAMIATGEKEMGR